jgi:nitrogen-specific signal transduction histidine kinase
MLANADTTLVLFGSDNAMAVVRQFYSAVKHTSKLIVDSSGPQAIFQVKEYNEILKALIGRGVKRQLITEITKDNLHFAKQLTDVIEIRHLPDIKGNFAVSETEYMATAILPKSEPVTQIIYSNAKPIVEQHQYLFDTLWKRALPAEMVIKEIESGVEPAETKTISGQVEIGKEIEEAIIQNIHWYICTTFGGLELGTTLCIPSFKIALADEQKRTQGRIRWITNFDKNGIGLVRMYLDMGIAIRHVKNVPLMQFGVGDRKFIATTETYEGGNMFSSALVSTDPDYVRHFNSVFEEMWKTGIDAKGRILDLERGTEPTEIDVIRSAADSVQTALSLIKGASSEILIFFATPNSFKRSIRIGVQEVYNEAAARGARIRILLAIKHGSTYEEEEATRVFSPDIVVKTVEQDVESKMPVLIVDRKEVLIWELKNDDDQYTVEGSVGVCLHSKSESIISSYLSIFESLWNQAELYEKLQAQEAAQQEFINIAAHELRTPIQPMLGMLDVLESESGERNEAIQVIARNVRRLKRLTEDILDVTKIGSGSLRLSRQHFDVGEVPSTVIKGYSVESAAKNVRIVAERPSEPLWVFADRERIAQVISNLVSNAFKFTSKGEISVRAEKKGDEIIVSVRDNGSGIDPEIMPRLFTKFATNSDKGTGLGLYICKSIIEAHGGKIWATNNSDVRGATFAFSLPIANKVD